jgi:peptidoglycan/xylan/chitin deacetylase (PgdA/CDA1 family)
MLDGFTIGAALLGTGALAGAGVAARGAFHPGSSLFGRVLWQGSAGTQGVALTFDDGPTPGITDAILDALGVAGAKAAFFVIGEHARAHPELLRRAYEEGHMLANHSMHHHRLGLCRRDRYWLEEVGAAQAAVEDAIGLRPCLFRPPMGFTSLHIAQAARAHDCSMITWSRRGFDSLGADPQRVVDRVLDRLGAGEIVVLHDGIDGAHRRPSRASVAAIPPILAGLERVGLRAVRLDELLGVDAYASS